jgi:glycosyltransferase involved in cell wall biosynthesis
VINYGIELDRFNNKPNNEMVNSTLRGTYNIPPNVPILLHIGRLDVDKSVDIVVRAAAKAMSCNDAHLLIVGDGTEKNKLIQLCKDLNISERSHFPGYIVSRQSLAEVYRIATLFVTASEVETQGIVLVEAAACGLPIVAVNATCIPEIVKHGKNGYLTAPKDSDGMANYLSFLLTNPDKAVRMGRAGYSIGKKFSKQKMIHEHLDLYARLISHSKYYSVSSQGTWEKLRTPFV